MTNDEIEKELIDGYIVNASHKVLSGNGQEAVQDLFTLLPLHPHTAIGKMKWMNGRLHTAEEIADWIEGYRK